MSEIGSSEGGLAAVLSQLQEVAGDAPFLALGQTVFWDEPMKAGVALLSKRLGYSRRLVAGVHDTDYFAKLPSGNRRKGQYKAFPHNDTTTRGLWSAAAEFSTLFGSETVVTRDTLVAAGIRLGPIEKTRPGILDQITEAWGWRGIVAMDDAAPITSEVPLPQLLPTLLDTFEWATHQSLEALAGEGRQIAERLLDELHTAICDQSEGEDVTLAEYYERLLPHFYNFAASAKVDIDTTRTTELLRFNTDTCHLPRFESFGLFVDPETRPIATAAYDDAIRASSSGLYELARFGTGAIPFDLVIPGQGRGTIRLGTRGAVINTPKPNFLSYKRPPANVRELAEMIEAKFGKGCVVVGKAVALIGMLAREFVFVFHEGASGYVKYSRVMHQTLARKGFDLKMNPLLRIEYDAWSALSVSCSWLRLPEPFQRPFGTEELCAPSFAHRWRQVASEQTHLQERLTGFRRPIELIRFLDQALGGSWHVLAEEYEGLYARLEKLQQDLEALRAQRRELFAEFQTLRLARVQAEAEKGAQWRAKIWEKSPTKEDLAERERLSAALDAVLERKAAAQRRVDEVRRLQRALVEDPEIQRIQERRADIELEAELKRLRLLRQAVIASKGLSHANRRPSGWWFPLVSPDGLWFRETVESARYYLEPLQ